MPVIHKYAQQIQSMLGSGGSITVDARVTIQQSIKILNDFRAVAISEFFRVKGFVPEQAYQTSSLVYDKDFQDEYDLSKCIYTYTCDRIIPVSAVNDGITYIGVQNGENITRLKSRSQISNYKKNFFTRHIVSESPWVLYEPDYNSILFHKPYGGPTKLLVVRAVFQAPEALPEYDIQHDEYPITDELFNMVLQLVQEKYFRSVMSSAPDTIPNATEDSSVIPQVVQNNNG